MLGLDLKTWLQLTVVGAAISAFGALLGIFLKDYFFSRSFERWKQRQTVELLYQKYRDPLFLSARELASRTAEILENYPTSYLSTAVLTSSPEKQIDNSSDDPYFQRYKLVSTAYRLSAFLGWLEIYRQENTYLHSGDSKQSTLLERAVECIREDLADGHIIKAKNWLEWRDSLIFREELRAIGESMIESRGLARTVIGYGRFAELLDPGAASPAKRWPTVVLNFLLDLKADRDDFRRFRLMRLVVHLVDLLTLLDARPIREDLTESRGKWAAELLKNKHVVAFK